MEIDAIRSQFIQDNLKRALQERDRERSVRAARAFRNYFQWFGDGFPSAEKLAIAGQLAVLEEACGCNMPDNAPAHAIAR